MSRKELSWILLVIVLMVISNALAQSPPGDVVPNHYICQVDDFEDAFAIGQAAVEATGGVLGHIYTNAINGFSIHVPPGIVMANLRAQQGVISVEPDIIMYAGDTLTPTGIDRIDAEGVRNSIDCSNIGIAIIDSGIQRDHPDLDVRGGRHFYTVFPRGYAYEDDQYDDDNGHGTHVAGIAAAKGGIVGVAPGAKLYAVKVLGANGSGYRSDIIKGIDWVTANASRLGIKVANMSIVGRGQSPAYYTAIANCPVVFTVCAGNSSSDIYGPDGLYGTKDDFIPAAYGGGKLPNVYTISAMADSDGQPGGYGPLLQSKELDDSFASFSNYSRAGAIDYILPGVNIYSTYLNSGYATMSGTSMAAPHAAGLFALEMVSGTVSWNGTDGKGLFVSNDPDEIYEPLPIADYSVPPQPTEGLHIGDLDGVSIKINNKQWQARVTITVHDDQSHNSVAGATVMGSWSNGVRSTATTNIDGTYTVSSGNVSTSTRSVTFTVTNVILAGYVYNSTINHDIDGGSDGTKITVNKP